MADDPEILPFATAAEWEAWLREHHETVTAGVWIRFARKASRDPDRHLPRGAAGRAALRLDRRPGAWPRRVLVPAALHAAPRAQHLVQAQPRLRHGPDRGGRMEPAGLREVERAKADGRWDAAYDAPSTATVPDDLQAALDANPAATEFFAGLDRQNRYAILHRVQTAKRPETRRGGSRRSSRCSRRRRRSTPSGRPVRAAAQPRTTITLPPSVTTARSRPAGTSASTGRPWRSKRSTTRPVAGSMRSTPSRTGLAVLPPPGGGPEPAARSREDRPHPRVDRDAPDHPPVLDPQDQAPGRAQHPEPAGVRLERAGQVAGGRGEGGPALEDTAVARVDLHDGPFLDGGPQRAAGGGDAGDVGDVDPPRGGRPRRRSIRSMRSSLSKRRGTHTESPATAMPSPSPTLVRASTRPDAGSSAEDGCRSRRSGRRRRCAPRRRRAPPRPRSAAPQRVAPDDASRHGIDRTRVPAKSVIHRQPSP